MDQTHDCYRWAVSIPALGLLLLVLAAPVICALRVEPAAAGPAPGMTINHNCADIGAIPEEAVVRAKEELHIAYGHTSHGSQIPSGMNSLVDFMNGLGHTWNLYEWNEGGTGGALDLDDYAMPGDLGNPDRVTWEQETRDYLGAPDAQGRGTLNPDVNVVMWSWCGQVNGSEEDIDTYLGLMSGLEADYTAVNFVYMTGHLNGTGEEGNVNLRNRQIRDYCSAGGKVLYDFADIESYDPDGAVDYMRLMADDNCDYDSDGNGSRDRNWAVDWQNRHVENVDWYDCSAAHSQPLNGNLKAYAAWWMFARLAGWNRPRTHSITVSRTDHGTITPAGTRGVVTVPEGNDQAFVIKPDSGYHVSDVEVDGVGLGALTRYTFNNVTADHRIGARFAADKRRGSTWYLAEGTTAWGFDCQICVQNPNATAVNATVTYMTASGPLTGGTITLPPRSQATVNPADTLGARDFSTRVECVEGKAIAADRTMSWTGGSGAAGAGVSVEAHASIGVTSPSRTWYFPEGCSDWGFETWLLIQNPGDSVANCDVTFMVENGEPVTVRKTVAASSRGSFNMAEVIGERSASIRVVSDVPVIPERAMYRNDMREGHDSIGTTTPATDYYLAEGTTGWGFTTYVLVQNPNASPTDVTVTYMTPSGARRQDPFSMPANARRTIRVNDVGGMENTDFSTRVHGSVPVIAERAMYWDNGTGEACHDSIGMSSAHMNFYLPGGQSSPGFETWTLVQNPNEVEVRVEVTYMTPNGEGNVTRTELIPARSRRTFGMSEHSGIRGPASIMVSSRTAGKPVMVERATYWNDRGAGTDTIGGFDDGAPGAPGP